MMLTCLLFLSLLSSAAAFTPPAFGSRLSPTTSLQMSTTDQEVPIILKGQNIELTAALVEHVNKRIGGTLGKLASGGAVTECDVVLSVSKNPRVCNCCCECCHSFSDEFLLLLKLDKCQVTLVSTTA